MCVVNRKEEEEEDESEEEEEQRLTTPLPPLSGVLIYPQCMKSILGDIGHIMHDA